MSSLSAETLLPFSLGKKKKYLPAFDLYISYRLAHCVIFFILSL